MHLKTIEFIVELTANQQKRIHIENPTYAFALNQKQNIPNRSRSEIIECSVDYTPWMYII